MHACMNLCMNELVTSNLDQTVFGFLIDQSSDHLYVCSQFHQPRNLLLALVGEVGELSEIFQWKGEVAPGLPDFSREERIHVGEELSDCLLYLVRLADVCGINISQAVSDKIAKNAAKYPAELCRGSAEKYTAYQQGSEAVKDAELDGLSVFCDQGKATECRAEGNGAVERT